MRGKTMNREYVSRTESRSVACPRCGSTAGDPCVGVREKIRESSHLERVDSARRARVHNVTVL